MKKLGFIGLCLAAATLTASAQMSVVKDAKKAFKPGEDFNIFVEAISPAFTNPETANLAETWYTAGEAGFKNFDNIMAMYQVTNQIDAAQAENMGRSLLKGYEYYLKALSLDSIPNEKGQVKPKFTSKILKAIGSNQNSFYLAGVTLFNFAKDYENAAKAWDIYLGMSDMDFLGKEKPAALDPTVAGEIHWYNALAKNWMQTPDIKGALADIEAALALGYADEEGQIFGVATDNAGALKDTDAQVKYARMGFQKTGKPVFMQVVVNSFLDKGDYAGANAIIDEELQNITDPVQKAPFYMLKGIIIEQTEKGSADEVDKATEMYKKSIEADPNYAAGHYHMGRIKIRKAEELDQATPSDMSQADYNAYQKSTLIPLKLEAAADLVKAYQLDNNLKDALDLLDRLSYAMNDAAAQKQVEEMLQGLK